MNFKQLEVFAAVARTHSFSKAAQMLFLTQPTVSAHLRALEEELGVTLIIRSTRAVYPSPAGAVLLRYADDLLALRARAECAVKNYPPTQTETLRIAASTVPAEYLLPQAIGPFREAYPHVLFSVWTTNSAQVARDVAGGNAQLGFCGTRPDEDAFTCLRIRDDRLVIVTPDQEPYRGLPRDDFPDELLRSAPFLMRMQGSGTRKEAERFLISRGILPDSLHISAYLDSTESVKRAVACGGGVAILSELAAQELEMQGKALIFRPDDPFLHRSFYVISKCDTPRSAAADLFLKYMAGAASRK